VYGIKSNNMAKYVELPVEGLRTRVQFPPSPPTNKNDTLAVSFLFVEFRLHRNRIRVWYGRGVNGETYSTDHGISFSQFI